jgi:hypothetical protein
MKRIVSQSFTTEKCWIFPHGISASYEVFGLITLSSRLRILDARDYFFSSVFREYHYSLKYLFGH